MCKPTDSIPFGRPISTQAFLRSLESDPGKQYATRRSDRKCVFSDGSEHAVPAFVNRFWSRNQRAGSSLHRIGYRDSFSPLLARFFIERLTQPNEGVYD